MTNAGPGRGGNRRKSKQMSNILIDTSLPFGFGSPISRVRVEWPKQKGHTTATTKKKEEENDSPLSIVVGPNIHTILFGFITRKNSFQRGGFIELVSR